MSEHSVFLSVDDLYDLPQRGAKDRARHEKKVQDDIKKSLRNIIGEEAIISAGDNKIVKVPLRNLELPRFKFGDNQGIGMGEEEGNQAGNTPGIDYYEAEITLDKLAAMVFEDLGLPFLEEKGKKTIISEETKFDYIRKKGILSNLDKRRTIKENLYRNAREGKVGFGDIQEDDLRFKTWEQVEKESSNAAVIAMRDVSGSMGEFEKYITRSFYFWMVRFLRTNYTNVDIVFITHHTEAREVDEDAFFNLGESGGTRVSSAYQLALDIIDQRYDPSQWNIYPFHFSDGDNWGEIDNGRCVDLVNTLLTKVNAFGYGEIQEGGRRSLSTLMSTFKDKIDDPHFIYVEITQKEDVYPALRKFFSPQESLS